MLVKAVTIKLSFAEMQALSEWLRALMGHSMQLADQNIHYRIQLLILGKLLRQKVYPKTFADTQEKLSLKFQPIEWMAVQAAVYNGWNYCYDLYVQNFIRHLSMNLLPQLIRLDPAHLTAPDVWEEE